MMKKYIIIGCIGILLLNLSFVYMFLLLLAQIHPTQNQNIIFVVIISLSLPLLNMAINGIDRHKRKTGANHGKYQ
jgi:hypothetical protein